MSLLIQFQKLVRDLDGEALDQLRQSVSSEIGTRRSKTAVRVEDIHPGMTSQEKEHVAREIVRVLEGQE